MKTIRLILFLICSGFLAGTNLYSQDGQKLLLRSVIDSALSSSPILEKIKFQQTKADIELEKVDAVKIIPIMKTTLIAGIVPEARGDMNYSPDKQTDLDGWGPFLQWELDFFQPLFTLGRIEAAENAAKEGIKAQEKINNNELLEFKNLVSQTYWAVNVLKLSKDLAIEIRDNYDSLLTEVEKELDNEDSDIDDADLLELKSNAFMIEKIDISTSANLSSAIQAFNELSGLKINELSKFPEMVIPEFDTTEASLDFACAFAESFRYDVNAMGHAVNALKHQYEFTRSEKFPMFYIAGGARFGWAPGREDMLNPFIFDEWNYIGLGAFLGIDWDINFLTPTIYERSDEAKYLIQNENYKLLKSKVRIDVTKAFNKVKENSQLLASVKKSVREAESWLALNMDNWDMGLGDAEKLIKSYNTYYQLRAQELELMFKYHKSLADFAISVSSFDKYLEWIDEGKVVFR